MQVISLCHLGLFVAAACLELVREQADQLSVKLLRTRLLGDGQLEQVLQCILSNAGNVGRRLTISWLVNGVPVVGNERRHRIVGNRLTLLTSSDGRRSFASPTKAYQCLARLDGEVTLISTSYFPEFSVVDGSSKRDSSSLRFHAGSVAFAPCRLPVDSAKPYFLLTNVTAPLPFDSMRFFITVYGLQVFNIRDSDSGIYRCCISNLCDAPTEVLIVGDQRRNQVDASKQIPKRRSVTVVYAEEGASVVLQCSTRNESGRVVSWVRRPWRNKEEALPATYGLTNGNFVLSNVAKRDEGIYACVAEGRTSVQYAFRVTEAFTVRIQGKKNGSPTFDLICESRGRPYAVLRLYRNGLPLLESDANVVSVTLKNDTSPRLIISVSDPPLPGAYQCLASFGPSSAQATLLISQRQLRKSRSAMDGKVPPTFDQELTNTTAELGSDVFMYSIATNADKVNWLFNGVPLEPDNKRIFSMGTSSLQIRNFSLSDQGLYTCVISNKYGRASSQAALEVEEPYEPTFTVDDPFDPSNDATLNRGKNLCKTTGLDKPLDPPRVNAMSDSSVLMRWTIPPEEQLPCLPLQFRIQYKRVPSVRSDSAESKQSVPPSARSYVVNDTQRSATSPARGDPAEWVTLDQGLPPTARSFVVNDLQPNHTYRFRYTILLRDLQPIQSRLSSRLTLGANPRVLPPRSPPELMTVVSKWPDAVQVKWEPPHEGAVPIDGYILQYRQVYGGVPVPYQNETIFGEEAREHMLDHLLPATPYEVRLVAFNSGGSSSPSDSMIASTLTLDGMQATINFFPETEDTSEGRLSSPNAPPSSQTTAYSIYTTAGAIFGVIVLCNIVIVTAYVIYRWRNGKRRQRRSSTSRNFNDTSYRLFRESAQRTRWQRQQQPMDDDLTLEPVAVNHCGPAAMRAARLGAFSTGCLKTVEHEPLVSILSQGGRFSPPNRGTL